MKYQVIYLNAYGNAEALAGAVADILPQDQIELIDLSKTNMVTDAETYCLCFEMTGNAIPLAIMDLVEHLERKTILLFAACAALQNNSADIVERKLLAFLPVKCNYLGVFVCAGQVSIDVIREVGTMVCEQPNNRNLKHLLEGYRRSKNHPDADDFRNLRKFIQKMLFI